MVSYLLKASVASGALVASVLIIKQLFGEGHLKRCEIAEPKEVFVRRYVRLRPNDAGCIIGKNGKTISGLEQDTGCFLRVVYLDPCCVESGAEVRLDGPFQEGPKDDASSPGGPTPFLEVIIKREEKMDYLVKLINNILRKNQEQRVEEILFVPRQYVGSIIGKRGSNLRRIRLATNTSIKIVDKDENVHGAKVAIYGSAMDVEAASEIIEQTIWEFLTYQSRKMGSKSERAELATIEQQLREARTIQQVCETAAASDW